MHHVKTVSQNIANSSSPKRCLLRGKFKSQSSVNKDWIVSVCSSHCCSSFSFPLSSLLLPLPLLFQLLFHFPLILLIPLSSTRVQIPIPLGLGAEFSQFAWTSELKRPLHCLPPVVLLPLGYFTHVRCPLPRGCSISQLWRESECPLQQDIYLLDLHHTDNSTVQVGFHVPNSGNMCIQREKTSRTAAHYSQGCYCRPGHIRWPL